MDSHDQSRHPYPAVMEWPYPVNYGVENEVAVDVLVLGGGLSGCSAAISAAKKGLKVAIVEKGCTVHSGAGGAGIDHWHEACTNPACKVSPEEYAQASIDILNGYKCGIGIYITCRESYDTLLELEQMGLKIRDTDDEFKGAPFRDDKTKHIFAYDYDSKYCITIWGSSLKEVLSKECKRLGVAIYDRIAFTSLLSEGGRQGSRIIGATGVSVRTGEFFIFRSKATVLCSGGESRLWYFSSEQSGLYSSDKPGHVVGEGYAAAWKAGAEVSLFEKSAPLNTGGLAGVDIVAYYGGFWDAEWRPCTMVDATGKEVPWVDRDGNPLTGVEQRSRPAPGQKFFLPHCFVLPSAAFVSNKDTTRRYASPQIARGLRKRLAKGDFSAPLYADLPSMPEHERRAIFGLHMAQEGRTWIGYRMLTQAGFNPDKHMLQSYPVDLLPRQRTLFFDSGGLLTDWSLGSNLEGLYVAGEALVTSVGAAHACATGRYAGRNAAEWALGVKQARVPRKQVLAEKNRVYAPIQRKGGMDWKELNMGICQIMQVYCGDIRNEDSLQVGLKWVEELQEQEAASVYARNPHELARVLEALSLVTLAEMVMHASLARKASSLWLDFRRSDYPEVDPPEWHKWVTAKLADGRVETRDLPIGFWGDLKENYETHGCL